MPQPWCRREPQRKWSWYSWNNLREVNYSYARKRGAVNLLTSPDRRVLPELISHTEIDFPTREVHSLPHMGLNRRPCSDSTSRWRFVLISALASKRNENISYPLSSHFLAYTAYIDPVSDDVTAWRSAANKPSLGPLLWKNGWGLDARLEFVW